jgi:hypothetical protein
MAESLDESDHLLVLEDYFDDEELDISFSNMSIDGKSQFSRFYSVWYVMHVAIVKYIIILIQTPRFIQTYGIIFQYRWSSAIKYTKIMRFTGGKRRGKSDWGKASSHTFFKAIFA